ncbi:wax ester/triacylglycerol synthase family O-acyltransferase [Nocardioidaceae bacterium]|nr:wax ester/triacylglycerol synthase family O-acyltransferase [Nocardioidaceae bacterium]
MGEHRVDAVDAIWLNMDRPENLMVIDAVMFLDAPVDRARLEDLLRTRLLDLYPVFSRRPVPARGLRRRQRWQDVEVDLDDHIRSVTLSAPGDDATLQRYVDGFMSAPLPRDRPLWEVHLVDGLSEGSAIFVRLHHAMADGIALTQVLFSLTDLVPEGDRDGSFDPDDPNNQVAAATAPRSVSSTPPAPPTRTPLGVRLARAGGTVLGVLAVLLKLLVTRNPASPVRGRAGAAKRAVWSQPIDLRRIKDIAQHADATVNDVLLSALSGALETYQVDRGSRPIDLPTMIPVNVRPLDQPLPRELGNRFALVLLGLPSGPGSAVARLTETKRRMDAVKASPEPAVTFVLLQGIGLLGGRLRRLVVSFFAAKVTGVTTNVPGPREARYLAGTRIDGVLGWVPGAGGQTFGTCIFTYAGTVRIGFKSDADVVIDPECLLTAFHAEIAALEALVTGPAGGHAARPPELVVR